MNQEYIVKAGDTLYGISNQFGVSVVELSELNNLNGGQLIVGQKLLIPLQSGTNPNSSFIYTVKNGDSLYSIANIYGTTVEEIKKLNDLESKNLSIGQTLKIPEAASLADKILPNYINYTVKKNDSLYTIAQRYGIDVNTIVVDNALNSDDLSIGQVLKIRIKETEVVEECFGEEYVPPTSSSTIKHTVKNGDNLYNLAKYYNVSVSDILSVNNFNNNNLSIGQILLIPVSSASGNYVVVKGDNIYSIARKFNTTVGNIMKLNNLKNTNLDVGQVLKV